MEVKYWRPPFAHVTSFLHPFSQDAFSNVQVMVTVTPSQNVAFAPSCGWRTSYSIICGMVRATVVSVCMCARVCVRVGKMMASGMVLEDTQSFPGLASNPILTWSQVNQFTWLYIKTLPQSVSRHWERFGKAVLLSMTGSAKKQLHWDFSPRCTCCGLGCWDLMIGHPLLG